MRITQEQFNHIIDLLIEAANAKVKTRPDELSGDYIRDMFKDIERRKYFEMCNQEAKQDYDQKLRRYNDALLELYYPANCPDILKDIKFLGPYLHGSRGITELSFLIDTNTITKQLYNDFKDVDDKDHCLSYTHSYTGYYKDKLEIDPYSSNPVSEPINLYTVQHATDFWSMDFLLQVMSHPVTPIIGAVLLLTGVAIMASGAGLVVGACVATAGAGLIAGFAATQLGFFSDRSETGRDALVYDYAESQAKSQLV